MNVTLRDEADRVLLEAGARTHKRPARRDRFRGVLMALEGGEALDIAEQLHRSRRFVQEWVYRYRDGGVAALEYKPRPGKPCRLDEKERQVLRLERQIQSCDLIVIDELGYLPLDRHGAEHLFGFFSQCYETTSLILTKNLPFADWPQVFANDERMTGALLDRLTHHVHIVTIEGDSYRLRISAKRGKKGEEPEPTT
jgi:IstB-like ATP binding protein/Homeodomain-like domain